MFLSTFLTAGLLMIDEIAFMVDRLTATADRDRTRETRIRSAVVRGGAVNYVIAISPVLLAGHLASGLVGPVLAVGGFYHCLKAALRRAAAARIG